MPLHRRCAHGGAELGDLRLGELADPRPDGVANGIEGGGGDQGHALLEIPVRRDDRAQQVLDKGHGVVLTVVPSALRRLQSVVIVFLRLGDLCLQRNIPPDLKPAPIQQQRRQQPGHAAVAVDERVDAQKVVDEAGDQQQRVRLTLADGAIVRVAQIGHGLRRFIRREGRKEGEGLTLRRDGADKVLHVLERAPEGAVRMAEHDLVQLQDIVRRQRNVLEVVMDRVQRVAVSRDLLFVAAAGRGFFAHELTQARFRGADALDGVGRLRTLHLGYLDQLLHLLRLPLEIHRLPALQLMDLRQVVDDLIIPGFFFQNRIIKPPHSHHLTLILVNFNLFDGNSQVVLGFLTTKPVFSIKKYTLTGINANKLHELYPIWYKSGGMKLTIYPIRYKIGI